MQTGWVGSNAFRIFKAIRVCSLRTQRAAKGGKTEIGCIENLHVLRCRLLLGCPSNALVQLQAHYHHRGVVASEKCFSAAKFVRQLARWDIDSLAISREPANRCTEYATHCSADHRVWSGIASASTRASVRTDLLLINVLSPQRAQQRT